MPRLSRRLAFSGVLLWTALWFAMPSLADGKSGAGNGDVQDQLLKEAGRDRGSGWIAGGGLAVTDPGYLGYSRQYTPVPLLFYHYGRFFIAGVSAGYLLSNGDHYRFSLTVRPEFNRLMASDSPALVGIQSRQWSLDGGANIDFLGSWGRFNVGVFHDILARNNGTQINAGYRYTFQLGDWGLTPGVGLRWENANLVNYYYGVSPAEALPGRPPYSPSSAFNPYVAIGLSERLNEHLRLFTNLQYMRFGGAIHNSPIVSRSDTTTFFIGLTYNPR